MPAVTSWCENYPTITAPGCVWNLRSSRNSDYVAPVTHDYCEVMKVEVDAGSCHGHQMCAIAAPEIFGSDEFGNAVVLVIDDVPDYLIAGVRRAEANCPERAVVIKE